MTEIAEGKNFSPEENVLSDNILHLFYERKVENASEALAILLHGFMLETGYIPTGINESDKYDYMPKNWKKNGAYKIQYYYKDFPQVHCWMTCVPLYNNLSVFGVIDSSQCLTDTQITLSVNKYVDESHECSEKSTCFLNVNELSRHFKDEFCFSLLRLLQEILGTCIRFGLNGLMDDLKLYILELLPVESVVACSAVNKKFNTLANSSYLWKNLFLKDFPKNGVPDIPSTSQEGNKWKEAYKEEYLRRKKFSSPRVRRYHPYHFPELFPLRPYFNDEPNLDFDLSIYEAFPHLRRQLLPPFFHPSMPESRSFFRGFF